MPLNAPYWKDTTTYKFQISIAGGATWTAQTNPTIYTINPETQVSAQVPAALGQIYFTGSIEMPPTAIALQWDEMAESDYITLANNFHLQLCTMIDMEDRGYYGMLRLGAFEYAAGVAQIVGKVTAVFMAALPAPGHVSTISTVPTPTSFNLSATSGGSLTAATTYCYALTFFTRWGETPAQIGSLSSGGSTNNRAILLSWTPPSSLQYRKARLYTAPTVGGLVAGSVATVLAEVWAPFTQVWTDTCNTAGNTKTATVPGVNNAFLGGFSGGRWQNYT